MKQIMEAIEILREAVKAEVNDNTVSFKVFINFRETLIEYETRYAEELQDENINMRNIKGKWIK